MTSSTSTVSGSADEVSAGRPLSQDWMVAIARIAFLTFQFGLVVLLVRAYQLESRSFLRVIALGCVGFPLHHFLPARFRMPFFVVLSLAGIAIVLGMLNAAWLVGLGACFLILAHLPIPFWLRIVLQFAFAAVLGAFRVELLPETIPAAIWPILGSMFMFRLIIYMYDLRTKAAPFDVWRGFAYFFMLPNVCFTLLPVIDYKLLNTSYYPRGKQAYEIYQKGAELMFRGVVHLLLYRLVYQHALVDPTEVTDTGGAVRYMVATFLLYLRISGYFHLIMGMLHMFGFGMPETHHLYFLASSFTDFWRRINIFWKDFMQKIFFYPVHFRISKKMSAAAAMALATVYAFLWTWFLHAYQWFWIRGEFPLTLQDALFWGGLGVVVLINLIWEIKFPKKRTLKKAKRTLKSELALALKTIGTFTAIVFIWNVWSTPSFDELFELLAAASNLDAGGMLAIIAGVVLLGGAAIVLGRNQRGEGGRFWTKQARPAAEQFWHSSAHISVGCLALLALAMFPALVAGSPALAAGVHRLVSNELNERDRKLLQRGYYEDLTNAARFNPELQALYDKQPAGWNKNEAVVHLPGFPDYQLKPSFTTEFKGATLTTNSGGLRDQEYAEQKPASTYRIALCGASHSLGSGVDNDQVFERLVEERLNGELAGSTGQRYEILNFSNGGYGPASKVAVLEKRALPYDPDGLIYVAIDDYYWVVLEVAGAVLSENEHFYFDPIVEIARKAGIHVGMNKTEAEQRLHPYREEIMRWFYGHLGAVAQERDLDLWVVFIPVPEDQSEVRPGIEEQMKLAREAGLQVLDITDAYGSVDDLKSLWVADWDRHPRAQGHKLLADSLYSALREPLAKASANTQ